MIDLQRYSQELQRVMRNLDLEKIEQIIEVLQEARVEGRMVFIVGNGGSASTASHFVCDLTKNTRRDGSPLVRAMCLSDNIASLTAYANDEGYETVFSGQLANLVAAGDVLIAISTSGNSKNVLRAIEVAKKHNATSIGFTGAEGGKVARQVDVNLYVPSDRIEYVEDVHLVIEHMITARLRESAKTDSLVAPEAALEIHQDPAEAKSDIATGMQEEDLEISIQQTESNLAEFEGGHFDRESLIQRMLSTSVSSVQAISGSIVFLNDNQTPELGILAHRDHLWESQPEELDEMFESGLAGWVVRHKRPVLVNNTLEDERWIKRAWETQASRSVLCIPMMASEKVIGVLTLVYPRREFFSEQDLILAVALAAGLSILATQTIKKQSVNTQ